MNRETRVQKYAKLREDIENIDEAKIKAIKEKKSSVVKESMKHVSSTDKEEKIRTSSMSIDDILDGHSKYVDLENYHIKDNESQPKAKLFIFLGVIFVIVILLVIITIFRRQ